MKINCSYNVSFTSKKPEVRKADDIQRKVKLNFPAISSSYIDSFSCSLGKDKRITQKKQSLFEFVCDKIHRIRESKYLKTKSGEYIPYADRIDAVKKIKAANCAENAHIAMAVLMANGYMNTREADLRYKAVLCDKETKKHLYTGTISLDHTCTVTDMNTGKGRNIVVDPWLGFAASKQNAIGRYKQINNSKKINQALYLAVSDYRDCCYMTADEIRKEYDVKEGIYLRDKNNLSDKDRKNLVEYIKTKYPELIF